MHLYVFFIYPIPCPGHTWVPCFIMVSFSWIPVRIKNKQLSFIVDIMYDNLIYLLIYHNTCLRLQLASSHKYQAWISELFYLIRLLPSFSSHFNPSYILWPFQRTTAFISFDHIPYVSQFHILSSPLAHPQSSPVLSLWLRRNFPFVKNIRH